MEQEPATSSMAAVSLLQASSPSRCLVAAHLRPHERGCARNAWTHVKELLRNSTSWDSGVWIARSAGSNSAQISAVASGAK